VETFLKVPKHRISTVHLAVSRKDFHPNPYHDELNYAHKKYGITVPYVVVASPRNWRTKNLATALDALVLTQKESASSFQTVMYGPRGDGAALAGNGRILNVVQTGFIPAADLGIVFRNAAAFIFPSLYEGFGLPLLEAMSCGCPVISSNSGSLGEIAGEGAQVFDPMDATGMANAIVGLLADPGCRTRWRSRALTRATAFSWEKAVAQTIAVYRHVARQSAYQRPLARGSQDAA
jgi:glycosyltransferase involved in cell wall biosynthesis